MKGGETFMFYSDLLSARPIPSCKRRAVHELIWNNVMVIRVIDSAAMYVMRPTSHIPAVIVAIVLAGMQVTVLPKYADGPGWQITPTF